MSSAAVLKCLSSKTGVLDKHGVGGGRAESWTWAKQDVWALPTVIYLQKCRISRSASLQSAGGIILQNLTPGPGCGSFSDHPALFPVQEQSNVFTHSQGRDTQECLA